MRQDKAGEYQVKLVLHTISINFLRAGISHKFFLASLDKHIKFQINLQLSKYQETKVLQLFIVSLNVDY